MTTRQTAGELGVPHNVAVIGAGAAGLVAAKKLRDAGFVVTVFERDDGVGGNWRFGSATSPVYRSTALISSKSQTAFRDFPMPAEWPEYVSHQQAREYLERYAAHFDLLRSIRLGCSVEGARRNPDGRWVLELADGEVAKFDALLVASGHHWDPALPKFAGSFDGRLLHARDYREPEPFRGQRVLVVGAGNTGCDIAVELGGVAAKVLHSTRRGYHYMPKFLFGEPGDVAADRLRRAGVPAALFQLMARFSATMVLGSPQRFGLPRPDHRVFESHPIVNSQLFYALGHGRIQPKPDVAQLAGDRVVFVDGSAEPVDVVIAATGYRLSLPFLDPEDLNLRDGRPVWFKNLFHPTIPNLAFCGFLQPNSGVWWLDELQAELVAAEWQGGGLRRRGRIRNEQATRYYRYLDSARHHLEVDYLRYERDLRRLLRQAG